MGNFLTSWKPVSFSRRTLLPAVNMSIRIGEVIECVEGDKKFGNSAHLFGILLTFFGR